MIGKFWRATVTNMWSLFMRLGDVSASILLDTFGVCILVLDWCPAEYGNGTGEMKGTKMTVMDVSRRLACWLQQLLRLWSCGRSAGWLAGCLQPFDSVDSRIVVDFRTSFCLPLDWSKSSWGLWRHVLIRRVAKEILDLMISDKLCVGLISLSLAFVRPRVLLVPSFLR